MKVKLAFATSCLILLLAGCTASGPRYSLVNLPSGRQVKVVAVVPMHLSAGAPALMLQYETDYKISDQAELRKEVDEIWSYFKTDVEKGNFTSAIISANEVPHGFIVKNGRTYNFVFEKQPDGTWQCLDDKKK